MNYGYKLNLGNKFFGKSRNLHIIASGLRWQKNMMFPPGIEPGTLRVWGARDNHYTTKT